MVFLATFGQHSRDWCEKLCSILVVPSVKYNNLLHPIFFQSKPFVIRLNASSLPLSFMSWFLCLTLECPEIEIVRTARSDCGSKWQGGRTSGRYLESHITKNTESFSSSKWLIERCFIFEYFPSCAHEGLCNVCKTTLWFSYLWIENIIHSHRLLGHALTLMGAGEWS